MTGGLVLGIETSCDETGVGVVLGRRILANVISTSLDRQAVFGGVVPEIAARAHLEFLVPTLDQALVQAGVGLADIAALAVTAGPGLTGALTVGIGAAKALAWALDKPLYGVNHLIGHALAAGLGSEEEVFPALVLLVSGGHTCLFAALDPIQGVRVLGQTLDDAAGEAFDKVARLLGLGYPGGPQIERVARGLSPKRSLPRALMRREDLTGVNRYNFSFSGLKTAVGRELKRGDWEIGELAAAFESAVVEVLVDKTLLALEDFGHGRVILAGGVAANKRLRARLGSRLANRSARLLAPNFSLCGDNGAMIAGVGAELYRRGYPASALDFSPRSVWTLEQAVI